MNEKITIKMAAKRMNISEQRLRREIECGIHPFAVCKKNSVNNSYYIYPQKFKEFIGELKGEIDNNEGINEK